MCVSMCVACSCERLTFHSSRIHGPNMLAFKSTETPTKLTSFYNNGHNINNKQPPGAIRCCERNREKTNKETQTILYISL